jgi:hypothetical protein
MRVSGEARQFGIITGAGSGSGRKGRRFRLGHPRRSDATWKEARLETGLEIMVSLFIAKGGIVRVDTAERKYAGKETP